MNNCANAFAKAQAAAFLLAVVSMLSACAGVPNFQDARDKNWNLAEIRTPQQTVTIRRDRLAEEGFGEIFTLRFDAERVSGIGAPNRYFAPYTLGEKGAITIKTVAGTMMAAIREPEELKEHEFFAWLQNVYKWNLAGERLELYAKGEDGAEAVLVFCLLQMPK